ncbi:MULTISPECIES: hypothetical protein [unclassified Pantoea]|jgi:hypothetical protein|uniref:hypothetical protein n=1 Tax=unclassified Pantoea TaxID=2630326 RepID=UPI0023DBB0FF|nr:MULTISPECIES: hypothetical protein [unclassified Pantoea]MDF2040831.1 hypothetical protein [Pantoea sp. Cr_R14]MDF2071238.1 hypothetical protein [Pantoea sp. Cr_R13]MDF2080367.1 hypothetical protein [Pantoea sp. Cr_R21]
MSDEITSRVVESVSDSVRTEPIQNHVIEGSLKVNGVPFREFARRLEKPSDIHGENHGRK